MNDKPWDDRSKSELRIVELEKENEQLRSALMSFVSSIKQSMSDAERECLVSFIDSRDKHIVELEKKIDLLRTAMDEFDNDDNWLIVSPHIDRKTKTGHSDWVYIGAWDPRVFATAAIKGEPLPNTEPDQRIKLSPYYEPDKAVTKLYEAKIELEDKLSIATDALKEISIADCPKYVAHPQSVWWEIHVQPVAEKALARIEEVGR